MLKLWEMEQRELSTIRVLGRRGRRGRGGWKGRQRADVRHLLPDTRVIPGNTHRREPKEEKQDGMSAAEECWTVGILKH